METFNFTIPSWHTKRFERLNGYDAKVRAIRDRDIELMINMADGPLSRWNRKPVFYDEIKNDHPEAIFSITHNGETLTII